MSEYFPPVGPPFIGPYWSYPGATLSQRVLPRLQAGSRPLLGDHGIPDFLGHLQVQTPRPVGAIQYWGLTPPPIPPPAVSPTESYPAGVRDRVEYFDAARSTRPLNALTNTNDFFLPGRYAFEITRFRVRQGETAVLQRIATWGRLDWTDGETNQPSIEIRNGSASTASAVQVEQTPFPEGYPVDGLLNSGRINLGYRLIVQGVPGSMTSAREPSLISTTVAPSVLPLGQNLISPWEDQRYIWDGTYTDDNYWVLGGQCLVRLFCVINIEQNDQPTDRIWSPLIGGRLSGWTQKNGPNGGAERAATRWI